MRIVENICMMACTHGDSGELDEQKENEDGMMFMTKDDTNQYDDQEHVMRMNVMNNKRERPDEEMENHDFLMVARQVNK